MIPDGLYYSKDHEWLRVEGDTGTIGITHFAQKELGDIVFISLPKPGRTVRAAEEFATVESVKAVSEIYAPVGGEVVETNTSLEENPDQAAMVNQDPYGGGWLVKIRMTDPGEMEGLMKPEEYRAYLDQGAS